MPRRNGILAAGNWIVDHVKTVDVYPAQDALANILSETRSNGGAPYNLLADLARLGAEFPLSAAGLVGDDEPGRWILEDCRRLGIDTAQLRVIPDAPTSYTDVMTVAATGRRTFFHQRGANARFGPEHLDFTRTNARFFHLGYLLLLDRLDTPDAEWGTAAARVLRAARAAGLETSVDVVSEDGDRFAALVRPALLHVDLLFLNEFEAGRVTGREIRRAGDGTLDRDALRLAASDLLAAGVRRWVVIHFPEGACAAGADGRTLAQGSVNLPAGEIAGAVGAGDALAAGVLLGRHAGLPMPEALRLGVCAAAASLREASSSGGVRPRAECLALGERFGFRPRAAQNS